MKTLTQESINAMREFNLVPINTTDEQVNDIHKRRMFRFHMRVFDSATKCKNEKLMNEVMDLLLSDFHDLLEESVNN
jgi:hypothetical protein